jgi:hypothetical protein
MQVAASGKRRPAIDRWVATAVITTVLVPFALVAAPIGPTWLIRAVAFAVLFIGMLITAGAFALMRKPEILDDPARRRELRSWKATSAIYYGGRVGGVVLGVALLWYSGVPFIADVVGFDRAQGPLRAVKQVRATEAGFPPVPFLHLSVWMSGDPARYHLYYSFTQPHSGETYDFTVLPRSHLILDLKREVGR